MSWTEVRIPATSANLGPGFDALGMALSIYLECRFRPSEALVIRPLGRDAEMISTGADNLIWQTALQVAEHTGRPMPNIELVVNNDIPIGKGLGSSAAALVAGVVIADEILGLEWDRHKILDEAARIEGHPDNVAAAVLGSIVASAIDSEGITRAVRLQLPARYGVAIIVPDFILPTSEARAALPATYSRADAVFNIQRSALLIAAMLTQTTDAFHEGLMDRLHQPYRARLVPGLSEMLELRAEGLLGCALSGAGPSVLVFYERGNEQVCELMRDIFRAHGHLSEILWSHIPDHGYDLLQGL
ncbi:MAG: homoserine kinase [Candidatus Solibacter usitatus]|nr:homoserine kinase [Candidatus Solibacter usitatus]